MSFMFVYFFKVKAEKLLFDFERLAEENTQSQDSVLVCLIILHGSVRNGNVEVPSVSFKQTWMRHS